MKKILIAFVVSFSLCRPVYAQDELILAVLPFLSAKEIVQKFTPLAEYLSTQMGMKVSIKVGGSFQEHINFIGQDKVDIAYMGPTPYVHLVDKFGKKPLLARLEVNGSAQFCSYIFTRKDGDVKTLGDLKGKSFAYGSRKSTMSFVLPHYTLMQAGIVDDGHEEHAFLKTHSNVALGVLAGDFAAGAIKPSVFKEFEPLGLKVIAESERISEHLFVTRSDLPDQQVQKLRKIFLSIIDSEEGLAALKSINAQATAMVSVQDSDYDNLRKIMETIDALHKH